jgi:hypothetical protein
LRNLQILDGEGAHRLSFVITNRRSVPVAATKIQISGRNYELNNGCGINEKFAYELTGSVTISGDGEIRGARLAEAGSPYSVPATGALMGESCYGILSYYLSAPVSISLGASEAVVLTLDIDDGYGVPILAGPNDLAVAVSVSGEEARVSRGIN